MLNCWKRRDILGMFQRKRIVTHMSLGTPSTAHLNAFNVLFHAKVHYFVKTRKLLGKLLGFIFVDSSCRDSKTRPARNACVLRGRVRDGATLKQQKV